MPINFDCPCGKTLRVPDEHAGRRVKCPACIAIATVPVLEPKFEVVEESPEPPPPKTRPVAKPATSKTDDDDDRADGVAKKSRRDEEEDEEEEERRRKKKKSRRAPPRESRADSGGGGSATGEIVGGLIAMAIGGLLIVLALGNGRIPIYGGVLFICGLVGLFKGLAGGGGG